jgi:hypothetical protein
MESISFDAESLSPLDALYTLTDAKRKRQEEETPLVGQKKVRLLGRSPTPRKRSKTKKKEEDVVTESKELIKEGRKLLKSLEVVLERLEVICDKEYRRPNHISKSKRRVLQLE